MYVMALKSKEIQWKARFDAWKESGQSIAKWCKDQDIKASQMYYWARKFESNESPDTFIGGH